MGGQISPSKKACLGCPVGWNIKASGPEYDGDLEGLHGLQGGVPSGLNEGNSTFSIVNDLNNVLSFCIFC